MIEIYIIHNNIKMEYIHIGIDLDNTLIKNYTRENRHKGKWDVKIGPYEYLPKLYKENFRFHVITAREHNEMNNVFYIIDKIENMLNIKFETITLTNRKAKCKYASELKCKYLIDDNKEFFQDQKDYNVIPILLYKKKLKDIICCCNWKEIYDLLVKDKDLL